MFCTSAASVVQNSALTGQLSSSRVDLFLLHSGDGRRALGDPRIMIGISTCETSGGGLMGTVADRTEGEALRAVGEILVQSGPTSDEHPETVPMPGSR